VPGLLRHQTSATWGVSKNRTCALRVIQGGPKSQARGVPYASRPRTLTLIWPLPWRSVSLWGIEHRIEPDEPITGNAYDRKLPAKRQLPRTLSEAAERLTHSKAAQELFGAPFVSHFAASREWEEREFRPRGH